MLSVVEGRPKTWPHEMVHTVLFVDSFDVIEDSRHIVPDFLVLDNVLLDYLERWQAEDRN